MTRATGHTNTFSAVSTEPLGDQAVATENRNQNLNRPATHNWLRPASYRNYPLSRHLLL